MSEGSLIEVSSSSDTDEMEHRGSSGDNKITKTFHKRSKSSDLTRVRHQRSVELAKYRSTPKQRFRKSSGLDDVLRRRTKQRPTSHEQDTRGKSLSSPRGKQSRWFLEFLRADKDKRDRDTGGSNNNNTVTTTTTVTHNFNVGKHRRSRSRSPRKMKTCIEIGAARTTHSASPSPASS